MLSAWGVILTSAAAMAALPSDAVIPSVVGVELAPEYDAKFEGKDGWIGGDCVYSEMLAPDRVLWLFGDTLLGTVKDKGRPGAVMVNNTVGVQILQERGAPIRFATGTGKDHSPASVFVPADGRGWFWPQSPVLAGERLFVFLAQIDKSENPGVLGFKHIGQWLSVVENPRDDPAQWRSKQQALPLAEFGPNRDLSWGSAVLADGDYLYIYGYTEREKGIGKKRLILARVPARQLDDFAAWRFLSSDGWSLKPTDAVPLADGLATEFSVNRVPDSELYVLVYTENGLGDRIVGRFANAPQGPWSAPVLLYRCVEMAQDKGLFSYAAKAHRWATTKNVLLISYCVNAWQFSRLFRDETVYRPKFIRVELKLGK